MHTIGKLAALAHVTTGALRYYERQGLIEPESRTPSRYRLYSDKTLRRVRFIKRAQACGFSIVELRAHAACGDVKRVAVEKKQEIDVRVKSLTEISCALASLIAMCAHEERPADECPLLDALERANSAS